MIYTRLYFGSFACVYVCVCVYTRAYSLVCFSKVGQMVSWGYFTTCGSPFVFTGVRQQLIKSHPLIVVPGHETNKILIFSSPSNRIFYTLSHLADYQPQPQSRVLVDFPFSK